MRMSLGRGDERAVREVEKEVGVGDAGCVGEPVGEGSVMGRFVGEF